MSVDNPRPRLLRIRSHPRRLVRPPARPADQHPVLRAHVHSNQQAACCRGAQTPPEDPLTAGRNPRPLLLEFLDLKDEYSETDLEDAIVRHLETFLLELGAGFTFVARQKRIRIGDEWYRIDLLLYHRRLRCLVVVDLKLGKFTHADAGQMNLYLNYAREHLMAPTSTSRWADPLQRQERRRRPLRDGGINANVFASRYLTVLPDPESLRQEIVTTQHALETRAAMKGP